MQNTRLDEAQAGIKIVRRNMQICRWQHPYGRKWRAFYWKWKRRVKKIGLKLNIQKTKIMASSPITSWQMDGETVRDFIFLGSKITADSDCSHEIKRGLLLGRKAKTNLDSILKSRDFANKGPSSQGYGFSRCHVWIWELDYKESSAQRIDGFELWCWRRLLRVPWTARRSNQFILKEISPGCSL